MSNRSDCGLKRSDCQRRAYGTQCLAPGFPSKEGLRGQRGLSPLNGGSAKLLTQTRPQSRVRLESNRCAQCPHPSAHETRVGPCCACRAGGFCETRKTKPSCCLHNDWCAGNIQCTFPSCSPRFAASHRIRC